MLERSDAAPDARDEALTRELGEIAAHGDLRHGEGLRKFRNLNVIPRLEQAEDMLHALRLREIAKIVHSLLKATLRLRQPQVNTFESLTKLPESKVDLKMRSRMRQTCGMTELVA